MRGRMQCCKARVTGAPQGRSEAAGRRAGRLYHQQLLRSGSNASSYLRKLAGQHHTRRMPVQHPAALLALQPPLHNRGVCLLRLELAGKLVQRGLQVSGCRQRTVRLQRPWEKPCRALVPASHSQQAAHHWGPQPRS